jgi:hypothetical protein
MKKYILHLLLSLVLLLGAGCRSSRVVSSTTATTRDSTTTVTLTPVAIHLAGESLKDTVRMTTFTEEFEKAQVGTVLRHVEPRKGKHLGYSITKISPTDWSVMPTMEPFDTTWISRSTATQVHITEKTKEVRELQPSGFAQVLASIRNHIFWLLALGAVALGIRIWFVTR